jgi:hypothetical protein
MYITKLRYRWILIVLTVFYIHALTQVIEAAVPSDGPLWMSNPYWKAGIMGDYEYPGFDAAGYSDKLYWGLSPRHAVTGYHEMLSGEWAAAIYYDGLSEAMWLTDYFRFPYWTTNSNFFIWDAPNQWDNPSNPVVGYDTGHSSIRNGQVEIDLDYEIVDLGAQGPNGEGGSPMAFGTFQGRPAYVRSERYVLLQTYTIANITANPLTNLEFYQMLHGHPGDEYSPVVYSVYETADYGDPMATYVPRNPVHSVGNFRYDITQWNDLNYPCTHGPNEPIPNHRDWIGFSSTVAPDVIENGILRCNPDPTYEHCVVLTGWNDAQACCIAENKYFRLHKHFNNARSKETEMYRFFTKSFYFHGII